MKTMHSTILTSALIACVAIAASAATERDSRIESSVSKSYVFKHYLKDDSIKVSSSDGAVSLTGSVLDEHHKTLAYETAAAVRGVKSVDNRLEIKSTAPSANSDAWLTAKVKTALLFHRSVSAVETEVDSKDGMVTLHGKAQTMAQKDLTDRYVRDIEGVKDVRNELTVTAAPGKMRRLTEKIDDSSITSEVKLTLLFHRSTSALKTQIKTNHGVVTLSGSAHSAAEKDLAGELANDVKGVNSVRNRITVKS